MAETSTATKRSMGTDIISSLPDTLLCHILSFLPTLNAVRTSFLSRRWRHLWKDLQVFDFDPRGIISSSERLVLFVDTVLSQRRFPNIRKFSLRCSRLDDPDALRRWMCAAVGPCLQEINLSFGDYKISNGIEGLFICDSLVSLSLHSNFGLNDVPSVHLPRLKNLELPPGFSVTSKLISGCPVLENLSFFARGMLCPKINLLSPFLKRLMLLDGRDSDNLIINEIQIDAPNLEFLHIYLEESCARMLIISDFPKIMEASLDIASKAEHVAWVPKLLHALSNIKKLYLGGFTIECLVKASHLYLPEFSCLRHLEIWFLSFNSRVLIKLLRSCPKLQVLKIDNTEDDEIPWYETLRVPSSWTQPARVPSCVMSHLNIVEFRRFPHSYSLEEREFFAYILQNALALKAIKIYSYTNTWAKETDIVPYEKQKEHILKEISVFPRASSICQVEEFTWEKWKNYSY